MLTVAESGERKSAVDSEAMRAAREHEKTLTRAYVDECVSHDAKAAEWESMRVSAKDDAKNMRGGGLAAALDGIGPAPQPPLLPNILAENFTVEGLSKMLANGQPAIGAFTDEAALVFGGHGIFMQTVGSRQP